MIQKMQKGGFSFIEAVVAISMGLVLIAVFGLTGSGVKLVGETKFLNQATLLAQEEMEAIRTLPFPSLYNQQSGGKFRGVLHPLGSWAVRFDSTAPSPPNVLSLSASQAIPQGFLIVPGDTVDNFIFETKLKVSAVLSSNWDVGILFRAQDENNHYEVRLKSQGLTPAGLEISKMVAGTRTPIFFVAESLQANQWYNIKTVVQGFSMQLFFGQVGTPLRDVAKVSDAGQAFSKGFLVLKSDQASASWDDCILTTSLPLRSWNFDADTVGQIPAGWERFGVYDLPEGQGNLIIQDYDGHATIKEAIMSVSWREGSRTPQVVLQTLIAQNGINP